MTANQSLKARKDKLYNSTDILVTKCLYKSIYYNWDNIICCSKREKIQIKKGLVTMVDLSTARYLANKTFIFNVIYPSFNLLSPTSLISLSSRLPHILNFLPQSKPNIPQGQIIVINIASAYNIAIILINFQS